jgi:transcription initiation factor IIE alpha subunit|nr:MAG TPA_asm: replication initiator protein [Caudoviricetes sp.]
MTVIVNKLPKEIWKMKLPLACKVIAERICALTKNGEKECFVSNAYLVNILGIGEKTVQRSLELLQDSKIIDIKVTRRNDKKVRLVYFIFDVQNCQNDSIKTVKKSTQNCQNDSIKTVKKTVFSIQSNDHISNDISNDQQTNTSTSPSHTQFSIEKIENDALYLQNIFTEEIMKLAKRNIEARNVSSFIESEKWLRWNRQNDKLKFIKSEKRLRELVSSWVLKALENVVTHSEVTNQEDLTEKRQAFLASLKY